MTYSYTDHDLPENAIKKPEYVISPDSARGINAYLKGLTCPGERKQVLNLISQGICASCGDLHDPYSSLCGDH